MDISDERLGDLWRMPDHYMRPISFARAVLALQPENAMIDVATRNLRAYLSKAPFASHVDREAALNCVDVLVQAAGGEQSAQEGK